MSVADDWAAREQANGVVWFRPAIRDSSETWSWTCDPRGKPIPTMRSRSAVTAPR